MGNSYETFFFNHSLDNKSQEVINAYDEDWREKRIIVIIILLQSNGY